MQELIDTSIEAKIIHHLKDGPITSPVMVRKIQEIRPGTPKQSIYLALRKLKKKEVIAISGKIVSLHELWVTKMKNFFLEASSIHPGLPKTDLRTLEDGEKVVYTFNSLLALDMFWAHAFMLFMRGMSEKENMLVYNPHQWFLIAREKSEANIVKEAKKRHISWLQLIGRNTALDKEVRKYFNSPYARCHFLEKSVFQNNYYMNCFSDLLIEVWIDEKAATKIENIYSNEENHKNALQLLQEIIEDKTYNHRMKISRNKTHTEKISNIFKRYFILPTKS